MSDNTDQPVETPRRKTILSTIAWATGSFLVGVGVFVAVVTFYQHVAAQPQQAITVATPTPTPTPTAPEAEPSPDGTTGAPEAPAADTGKLDACEAFTIALGTPIGNDITPLANALRESALLTNNDALREAIIAVADGYSNNDLNPDTITTVADICNAG